MYVYVCIYALYATYAIYDINAMYARIYHTKSNSQTTVAMVNVGVYQSQGE